MHKHWDYLLGVAGIIGSLLTKDDIAIVIGLITIPILLGRLFIVLVSAWQKWRDRQQPYKGKDE